MRTTKDGQSSFAYYNLKAVVPLGAASSLVSVAAITAISPTGLWALKVAILSVAAAFWFIQKQVLPRITTAGQLDALAFFVYGGAATATFVGAYTSPWDSPVAIALLPPIAAFGFSATWNYVAFATYCVIGHTLARSMSGFGIEVDHFHLMAITPVFCFISRGTITYMQSSVLQASADREKKVEELERERERRRHSEKQLIHAQKMEGLGLVAAGVAHDFNNHLQAISTFAELIANDVDVRVNAEQIQSAAFNASHICRQMLAYAGKSQEIQSTQDLGVLVSSWRRLMQVKVPANIAMRISVPNEMASILGSASSIQQCVLNLIQNAVEACHGQTGAIHVRVSNDLVLCPSDSWRDFGELNREISYVVLEVEDTGTGMAAHVLERAFDPYFSTKASGHGFGLAMTLGIVRTHGGVIRVQTSPGKGSRFQLCFPCARLEHQARTEPHSIPADVLPCKVLLVDDEASIRRSVSQLLRSQGCTVRSAAGAREALSIIEESPDEFDLMLVDYSMPEMSGIDFIEAVRERGHSPAAILCTGYAEDDALTASNSRLRVLKKPFRLGDLSQVIRMAS